MFHVLPTDAVNFIAKQQLSGMKHFFKESSCDKLFLAIIKTLGSNPYSHFQLRLVDLFVKQSSAKQKLIWTLKLQYSLLHQVYNRKGMVDLSKGYQLAAWACIERPIALDTVFSVLTFPESITA